MLWVDCRFAVGSRGRSRSRRSCPQSASAARSRRARLGRLAGGFGGALPPRRSIRRGFASFALLAWAAAQHGSAAAAQAARSQGVRLEARGWVTFHGAKKIFMIFLRCAAFRASAGCCSVLRIGILAVTLRTVRWRFDPAFLLRCRQRRLSRALCGIGGAEIEGSRRAFPLAVGSAVHPAHCAGWVARGSRRFRRAFPFAVGCIGSLAPYLI